MRPQDSVHLRHAQLLSLRDQLQAKVDLLNRELENKTGREGAGSRRQDNHNPSLSTRFESSINI
jgi:hypothetical protein